MNIPQKYQIFPSEVFISDKDEERLRPSLANWSAALSPVIATMGEADLRRLLVMELMDGKRPHIIDRLVVKLKKAYAGNLKDRIARLL